jgi:hypothetical protein
MERYRVVWRYGLNVMAETIPNEANEILALLRDPPEEVLEAAVAGALKSTDGQRILYGPSICAALRSAADKISEIITEPKFRRSRDLARGPKLSGDH